jgi:hypothetical protein
MLVECLQVLLVIAAAEDPAEDLGMQRLQPAMHHLGKFGIGRNILNLQAGTLQMPSRAARTVDLDSTIREASSKVS